MQGIDEKLIAEVVKKLVMEYMNGKDKSGFEKVVDKSGIMMVKTSTVEPEPFNTGKPGDKVYLKDIFTLEESPHIACGVMEMKESAFDWTLNYDEIDYVIDGTLEIIIDGRTVTGNKGDIIMIPMGSTIKFSCPDFVRFFYVTYPANWAEQ